MAHKLHSWDYERSWGEYSERIDRPCAWCNVRCGGTKAYECDCKPCCSCCWCELAQKQSAPKANCSCLLHDTEYQRTNLSRLITEPIKEP